MSRAIEDWKERNLRRVDIAGIPTMVLGDDAVHRIQARNTEFARMKMALHRIARMEAFEFDVRELASEALKNV